MERKVKIAVLVSGGGTNLQALIDAERSGIIASGEIVCVISSKAGAYALERAKSAGIDVVTVARKDCATLADFEAGIVKALEEHGAEVIILAGFMSILSEDFTRRYSDRIINVHPALIPSFCGKGYYGLKVHEEALKKGVKVSGATVHLVNEVCDGGEILAQKAVQVKDGDTPEKLQRRIMEQAEWKLLPEAAEKLCRRILGEKKPETPAVILEKWEPKDAETLAEIIGKIDRKYLSDRMPNPYTEKDAIWYITEMVQKCEAEKTGVFSKITVGGKTVGNISVEKLGGLNEHCGVIGYFLLPEYYGKGIMTEAAKQICAEAFEKLGVIRIEGRTFEPNMASRRVLEKAGFELEGILKNAYIKNGKVYNACVYGLTKGE